MNSELIEESKEQENQEPSTSSEAPPMFKKVLLVIWALLAASCLGYYAYNPEFFKPANLKVFLDQFQSYALFVFLLISMFRGLTLLPSATFVIAGTLLFPNSLVSVLVISMVGVVLSAAMIYSFSQYLGIAGLFEKRYKKKIEKMKERLDQPKGFIFVALWSWFPFVPTDLICYVAGVVEMKFRNFLFAIFIGELVVIASYIWGLDALARAFGFGLG